MNYKTLNELNNYLSNTIDPTYQNGLDIEKTLSCYDPIMESEPCNKCPSCRIRNEALNLIKKGTSNEIP